MARAVSLRVGVTCVTAAAGGAFLWLAAFREAGPLLPLVPL